MSQKISTPKDLANLIFARIKAAKTSYSQPSKRILNKLFEILFFSSLKTEESQLIKVTITFIDPKNPDPNPPQRIVADRWSYIKFDKEIPFSIKNLVKLSKAADPWSSSLAVYYDEYGELFIWGMIDQAIHYQKFLNFEAESGPEQPGLFQANIKDIGNINVMIDYELVADLKQNILVSNYIDIFDSGPISEKLKINFGPYKNEIRRHIEDGLIDEQFEYWESYISDLINESISRILIGMQNYHHGGAFLITSNYISDLDIKYKISYDRLYNSIINFVKFTLTNYDVSNEIENEFVNNEEEETIPTHMYLDESISRSQLDDTRDEIKGALKFISSLSCIDGLVVLTPTLEVKGFGAVIKSKTLNKNVYISQTPEIIEDKISPIDTDHFGTRHRSMFNYCWDNAESLGFVVSQDGDIRAITRVADKLVMWENIKVQHSFLSEKLRNVKRGKE